MFCFLLYRNCLNTLYNFITRYVSTERDMTLFLTREGRFFSSPISRHIPYAFLYPSSELHDQPIITSLIWLQWQYRVRSVTNRVLHCVVTSVEPIGSSPWSQYLATRNYPEPDQSNPRPQTTFIDLFYYPPICAQVFQVVYSLQAFQLKFCAHFSCGLHAPPILSSLIWSSL
jgi:hypothetical protein